jgi:hypothetical protein
MDPDQEIAAALTAVDGDPDDDLLRDLAADMLAARRAAEARIAQLRSWVAGESTALERAEPALLKIAAMAIVRWQAAQAGLIAAARTHPKP